MIEQIVIWILCIYAVINIIYNIFLHIVYRDIKAIIRLDKKENIEYVVRTLTYKLWFLKDIIYINNSNDKESYDIIKKLEGDYGVKIINLR